MSRFHPFVVSFADGIIRDDNAKGNSSTSISCQSRLSLHQVLLARKMVGWRYSSFWIWLAPDAFVSIIIQSWLSMKVNNIWCSPLFIHKIFAFVIIFSSFFFYFFIYFLFSYSYLFYSLEKLKQPTGNSGIYWVSFWKRKIFFPKIFYIFQTITVYFRSF